MKTFAIALAALTLSAAMSVPALAGQSTYQTINHNMRSSKLVGVKVMNAQKETVGTINDVLVSVSGQAPKAVIDVGTYVGGGAKLVLVPLSVLKFSSEGVTLPMTKERLAAMKSYDYQMADDSAG